MKTELRMKLRRAAVIVARLFIGAVFVVSGWSKAVDPAGFIIKVGEYLGAWGWTVPHEAIVVGCMALSAVEFTVGVMVACGCLKRVAVWLASALMVFMLPLTLYIAVANPVADCGCFGDLWKISNWATFWKNVIIGGVLVYLILHNRSVPGIYPAPIQWLVATVSLAFPLTLSFIGYHIQPVADFRPFRLGTEIFHPGHEDDDDDAGEGYVYERGGQRRTFGLDEIPDSTWTFVSASVDDGGGYADIAVRDDEGEDVSRDIVADGDEPQVWLIIPDPGLLFLSNAHEMTQLHRYLSDRGIDFTALVGSRGAGFRYWTDLIRPTFPVYSAEDTALQQLARGNSAIVYTRGGRIIWQRTFVSLPDRLWEKPDPGEGLNPLDDVRPVDDGRYAWGSAFFYLAVLAALYLLGQSPKLVRLITMRHPNNKPEDSPDDTPED